MRVHSVNAVVVAQSLQLIIFHVIIFVVVGSISADFLVILPLWLFQYLPCKDIGIKEFVFRCCYIKPCTAQELQIKFKVVSKQGHIPDKFLQRRNDLI